jgi:hypothetical protein
MPNNITDVITYTSPIQTVADGDAASGANFALAPQGLANRNAFLKNILGVLGVNLLMSGNAAAMQALTNASHPLGVANGAVFFVPGQGIYTYVSAGALTVDNRFVYAATGLGSGQWQHEALNLLATLGTYTTYNINQTSTAANTAYALSVAGISQGLAFTLTGGNTVQVPAAGTYRFTWGIQLTAAAPTDWFPTLNVVGNTPITQAPAPFNSSQSTPVGGHGATCLVAITTPGTQLITLKNASASATTPQVAASQFRIERVIG